MHDDQDKGLETLLDHHHRNSLDSGVSYEFKDAYQLLQDFFEKVDEIINDQER